MADMTRQTMPSFSMASCRAMALMTVESMPMWSAATRSMSMACWATPRKKLPPPTTMPISHAERVDGGDLGGYFVNEDGIDAETRACCEGFSGELEEDSFVHVRTKYRTAPEGRSARSAGGSRTRPMETAEGVSGIQRRPQSRSQRSSELRPAGLFLQHISDGHAVRSEYLYIVPCGLDIKTREVSRLAWSSHGDDRFALQRRI